METVNHSRTKYEQKQSLILNNNTATSSILHQGSSIKDIRKEGEGVELKFGEGVG